MFNRPLFTCKIAFALILALLLIHPAKAALINGGGYTFDEQSGLDWLDLSATQGQSYNEVLAAIGPGGSLAGWSVASAAQVSTFFDNAGGTPPYDSPNASFPPPWIPMLTGLWGDGYFLTSDLLNDGLRGGGRIAYTRICFKICGSAGVAWIAGPDDVGTPDSEARPDLAVALYRDPVNPVPIPAAAWLFGTALVGFVGFSRRRKLN